MALPVDHNSPLISAVKAHDLDRYIANLYAPEDKRPALWALFAFVAELARVRGQVSEAGLGEIRFEWWRTAVDGASKGQAAGNPVTDAIMLIAADTTTAERLMAIIDGFAAGLYADPMRDMTALEAHFGAIRSLPIRIAIDALATETDNRSAADAAGHAGVALGLAELVAHFGQIAQARPDLIPEDIRQGPGGGLPELQAAALLHLGDAVSVAASLPSSVLPALLPLAPLRSDLGRPNRSRGPVFRQWAIWRAARRGRLG